MASARRGYVPVDTTTTLTKRRRLSSFNTCLHSSIDAWNDIFSFNPCGRRRHSFHSRNLGQKVHFLPHSASSRYSSGTIGTISAHRYSFSSATPLRPILKSSAAYRHSLQASRTSNSVQTSRDSRTSTSRPSTERASTSRQAHRSSSSPDSVTEAALRDAHEVALTLVTMQSLDCRISTFRGHLSHLSHRATILREAAAESSEARGRQVALQTKYLACLSKQTAAMNELARGVNVEVQSMLAIRGDLEVEDSDDSDVESFLGRRIAFEPECESLGRSITMMDIGIRHEAIMDELEVLKTQMELETLERGKLFSEFVKMSGDLKDEVDDVVDEKDAVKRVVTRSGGRQETEVMEKLEERLTMVRRQYIEKSKRISDAYLAMDEKDLFKC